MKAYPGNLTRFFDAFLKTENVIFPYPKGTPMEVKRDKGVINLELNIKQPPNPFY